MYDRDQARRMLEEELSGPQYQRQFTGPVREAIDAFFQWLQNGALSFGVVDIPAGPLVVLILVAVGVLTALMVIRPRLQLSRAQSDDIDIEPGITAEQLRRRAEDNAAGGHFDHAARDRFAALVRSAEERGLLTSLTGRTATEISAQLARLFSDHADQLRLAAELFNQSRYGGTPLSQQHYQQLRSLDVQLLQTEPSPSSAAAGPRLVVPQ